MTQQTLRKAYQPPVQLPPIPIILPERQEFRVVEYTKTDDKGIMRVVKVQLEMRTHYFDQDGIFNHSDPWSEVERVQIDMDA
jgi:hypothetical protein